MRIRKTRVADIEKVMEIYDSARQFMRDNGNALQWINNYPDRETVFGDIEKGQSYVCLDQDEVVAVMAFIIGDDPTYHVIENGSWLNDEEYGVIHRLASIRKGAGSYCLSWCSRKAGNLRADTHEVNIPMQNLLVKQGFKYCGVIHIADGTPRWAYHKITGKK